MEVTNCNWSTSVVGRRACTVNTFCIPGSNQILYAAFANQIMYAQL